MGGSPRGLLRGHSRDIALLDLRHDTRETRRDSVGTSRRRSGAPTPPGGMPCRSLLSSKPAPGCRLFGPTFRGDTRSEEHTSELQSLMRISYAVFCLKKTT